MSDEQKRRIFAKYNEITAAMDIVERFLLDNYAGDATDEQRQEVTRNLIRRANRLLADFAEKVTAVPSDADLEALNRQLEEARQDTVLFGSMFQVLRADGEATPFDSIKNLKVSAVSPVDLTAEERDKVKSLCDANLSDRANYPTEALKKEYAKEYERLDSMPSTKMYILEHNGNVVSVVRHAELSENGLILEIGDDAYNKLREVVPESEPVVYGTGRHVRPDVQRMGINTAFINQVLAQEDRNLVVKVLPEHVGWCEKLGYKNLGTVDTAGVNYIVMLKRPGQSQ